MSFSLSNPYDISSSDELGIYLAQFRGQGAQKLKFPPQPFMGLRPYSQEDAPLFWGSEDVLQHLFEFLNPQDPKRVFLLWGQVNVGKSSLLQAGFLGRLPQEFRGIYMQFWGIDSLSSLLEKAKIQLDSWGTEQPVVWILDQWEVFSNLPFAQLAPQLQQIGNLLSQYPLLRLVVSVSSEYKESLKDQLLYLPSEVHDEELPPLQRREFQEILERYEQGALQGVYNIEFEQGLKQAVIEQVAELPASWRAPRFQLLMHLLWEEGHKEGGKLLLSQEVFGKIQRNSFPPTFFEMRLPGLFPQKDLKAWKQLEAYIDKLQSGMSPKDFHDLSKGEPSWLSQLENLGLVYQLDTPYQALVLPVDPRLLPWIREKQKELLKPVLLNKQTATAQTLPKNVESPSPVEPELAVPGSLGFPMNFSIGVGLILLGLILGWASWGLFSNRESSHKEEGLEFKPIGESSLPVVELPGDGSLPRKDSLVLQALVKPNRADSKLSLHRSSPSILDGLIPKSMNQDQISFTLENISGFQFPLNEFSIWLKGEETLEVVSEEDFEVLQYDSPLSPHHAAHFRLRLKDSRPLSPDAYKGSITLYFPPPVAPVELELTVFSRMSALWALLVLFLGIILGRMIRGVSENEERFKRMDKIVLLRSKMSTLADPLSKNLLSEELRQLEKILELSQASDGLEQLDEKLRGLEHKIELLEQVDRLALKLNSTQGSKPLEDKLHNLRETIFSEDKQAVDEGMASLNKEVQSLFQSDNSRSIFGSRETLATYQLELGKMLALAQSTELNPVKQEARKTSWEKGLARWIGFLSGIKPSTKIRYWFFRPLVTFMIFVVILLLGFDEIYLKGANTFGSGGIFDVLKLFLWGAVSDVFSRNLGENKALESFLKR